MSVGILGTGIYLPEATVHLAEVAGRIGLSPAALERKGTRKVHVSQGMAGTAMALRAAQQALERAGVSPEDLDLIIYAQGFVPDYLMHADYAQLQEELGACRAWAFKLDQACNSQLVALELARSLLSVNPGMRYVLVASAETFPPHLTDRFRMAGSCFLSDGASAAVVGREAPGRHLLAFRFHTDGRHHAVWQIPVGGTAAPVTPEDLAAGRYFWNPAEQARRHFRSPVEAYEMNRQTPVEIARLFHAVLCDAGLTLPQVRRLICYNMTRDVIEAIRESIGGVPEELTSWHVAREVGHIGAVDPMLNWHLMEEEGALQPGDIVGLVSGGFGQSWAAGLVRV
ncbi:3-oxoacyl-[acyl-carrier-protein] synthase-3 [Symbiobacterium terraclitae]|uniref:3-oxoacyl-[acyl-carrier-protein] synthase-3 n=1 Tax=Symbiobacterium terraclitae TaxID=557451 RepID=A0ABS4JTP4_9FIRM|nr:3-oxoacyl-[acyl-carrier-protein] synthase-3 [Symbiobacterium terraclitae]